MKTSNWILVLIVLALVAGGIYYFTRGESDIADSDQAPASGEDQNNPRTYSLAEVAAHSTPQDCWLAISGKVYNVSGFGDTQHPGRQAVYQGCGKDATTLYETRPMGSGTPHSDRARSLLPNFYIGDLR